MSKQIKIRLPDHLVKFLDELVADGRVRWRAYAVATALMDYEQQLSTERDAETQVLTNAGLHELT